MMKFEVVNTKSEAEFLIPLVMVDVRAGFPSPAMDYAEERINLNNHLVRNPTSTFFIRCKGESMNSSIKDGALLVVDRSITPSSNKIVIAVVDGEFTVKRIKKIKNKIYLVPENENFQSLEITDQMECYVWGTVAYIINKAE